MPSRQTPVCVLVSGGLDSALLLARQLKAGFRVLPVYVRCGLVWEDAELYWLRRLLRSLPSPWLLPLRVVDVPLRSAYGPHWSLTGRGIPGARSADRAVYLPGRNLLLISHIAIVCARERMRTIALGVLKGNPFGDASPQFFRRLGACLTQAFGAPIGIATPLRRCTKADVIRASAGVPVELTFSCLQPRGLRHCGRCNKCAERQRAFREAGVPDPTTYAC